MLESLRTRLKAGGLTGHEDRSFAVLAVLWPAKRFADEDFIAGGAASLDAPAGQDELVNRLEDLKGVFDSPDSDTYLEHAKGLIGDLESSKDARDKFAELIKSALQQDMADDEDASDKFFELDGDELMSRLATPNVPAEEVPPSGGGGAATMGDEAYTGGVATAAGAAGIGDFFADMKAAARNLLNFATYYQMKSRAGTVGRNGVNEVLRRVRTEHPNIRLHLAGHSFGDRGGHGAGGQTCCSAQLANPSAGGFLPLRLR
jgi:hypothetical protein